MSTVKQIANDWASQSGWTYVAILAAVVILKAL